MSLRRLRGGCSCGRNEYTISLPGEDSIGLARVLFDTDPRQRIFQASPLATFLRVPLSWYRSSTLPFFPDETSGSIRRTYTHPTHRTTKRGFCGYCGTPLSYWSEEPPSEASFIRLTLGSLCHEDLCDLEDLGFVPDAEELLAIATASSSTPRAASASESAAASPSLRPASGVGELQASERGGAEGSGVVVARETLGVPWFDSILSGSQLGRLRSSRGGGTSRDGRVKYEWEVIEWTTDDDVAMGEQGSANSSKWPKLDDGGDASGLTEL